MLYQNAIGTEFSDPHSAFVCVRPCVTFTLHDKASLPAVNDRMTSGHPFVSYVSLPNDVLCLIWKRHCEHHAL